MKNIPIQNPNIPRQVAKIPTINNPKSTIICFLTILKLALIAAIADKSPKIISGIVKNVKNEMI